MRRLDTELWTPFIKLWGEARDAGLDIHELAQLTGINVNTLCSRQFALRQRGIMLPLLRGQRGPRGSHSSRTRSVPEKSAEPKRGADPIVIYVM